MSSTDGSSTVYTQTHRHRHTHTDTHTQTAQCTRRDEKQWCTCVNKKALARFYQTDPFPVQLQLCVSLWLMWFMVVRMSSLIHRRGEYFLVVFNLDF